MNRLCTYCGASAGRRPEYLTAAASLGETLAQRNIGLVYGGGNTGMMGAVARAAADSGGETIGIIPHDLLKKETPYEGLSELLVVDSMHERKAMMAKLSDGFAALPGGLGTLEELFEVWTWAQLGFQRKPCALMNVEGYFDPLIAFLDRAVSEGFVKPDHRAMLIVEENADDLIDALVAYAPPEVPTWLTGEAL
jgi:uncharacterized protein (TIGR00730 family)